MYDASERTHIKEKEREARIAERNRHETVLQLMDSEAGRQYVHSLFVRTHIFDPSFDRDAIVMAFREGERNVGLQILNDVMQVCPDQYVVMMQEHHARTLAADARLNAINDRLDREFDDDEPDPTQYVNYDDGAAGSAAKQ